MRTGIALLFCLFVSAVQAQTGRQIFVATTGNASAAGTETQPVGDLASALKLAESESTKRNGKIEIIVRGGTYYFDKTIEVIQGKTWNSKVPLSIEAYKGETVIFHGGKTIDNELIKPVSDPKWLARFQPEFRNKIREFDLKPLGVDPGVLRPVGFGRSMAPSWMELFLNHQPGVVARWPNKGTVPIDSVLNSGSADTGKKAVKVNPEDNNKPGLIAFRPVENDYSNVIFKPADTTKKVVKTIDTGRHGGTFYYNDTRPSAWKEPKKVWLTGFFNWGYADDAVPVAKIDTIRRIITTALPTKYGFATGKPWRAYYAYNIPEEIDAPGEYYVDSATRVVYLLPPDKLKNVEVSVLEDPMMRMEGVSNVDIKNIQFTCTRGMGIDMMQTHDVNIDGCTFSNMGMMAIYVGKKGVEPTKDEKPNPQTVLPKNAVNIINYIYDNTIYNSEGGTNNGIINCKVYNTGTGGIYLSGGDRLKLEAANNFVKNCIIHDYNRIEKTYRPAVYIGGVGNSISNCDIYNAPSVAILLHGNNHVIEYNIIHNTTLEVDDMGAVYYGRDPSERGNVVRYNYFHNLGGQNKTEAIYHDDGACGMSVIGNVFYRAGTVSGFIGGGQDNNYTNNIFLNVRYALHIDKRLNNWAKGVIADSGLFEKRLKAVNYTQPPYSTAYPTLKDYFNQAPDQPQRNRFYLNLLVNVEEFVEGDTSLFYVDPHNYQTDGDPGFKDYAGKNFNIKKGSIIYSKLPGFVAPPLDKMGYHKTN